MNQHSGTIEGFIQFCRAHSLSLTPQRLAIYQVLSEDKGHPNAEAVYEKVRQQFPMMSLTTVYKTLETFCTHGLIRKVNVLHEAARYEADLEQHYHLVCISCKGVWDLHGESYEQLEPPERVGEGFTILSHHVQFQGLCAECQKD